MCGLRGCPPVQELAAEYVFALRHCVVGLSAESIFWSTNCSLNLINSSYKVNEFATGGVVQGSPATLEESRCPNTLALLVTTAPRVPGFLVADGRGTDSKGTVKRGHFACVDLLAQTNQTSETQTQTTNEKTTAQVAAETSPPRQKVRQITGFPFCLGLFWLNVGFG